MRYSLPMQKKGKKMRKHTQLKIREDSRQIFGREGRDRVVEADLPFSRQIQPRTWRISRPPRDGRLISPDLGRISTEISHLRGVAYIYIYMYMMIPRSYYIHGPLLCLITPQNRRRRIKGNR